MNVSKSRLSCDVLLFVATSTEFEELKNAAKKRGHSFDKRTEGPIRYFDMHQVGRYRVNVVRTAMGPFSHNGSASMGIHLKILSGASGIIQLGMAFGVDPTRQRLGDVLASTCVFPYDSRKVRDVSPIEYKVDYSGVRSHSASNEYLDACRKQAERGAVEYNVFLGGILSGGAHIASARFLRELIEGITINDAEEAIVGGEMEAVGLLSVSPVDEPCWMIVKGISDFADEHRDGVIRQSRPIACRNAAEFMLDALAAPV